MGKSRIRLGLRGPPGRPQYGGNRKLRCGWQSRFRGQAWGSAGPRRDPLWLWYDPPQRELGPLRLPSLASGTFTPCSEHWLPGLRFL